jgi:hypothetical protein
VEKCCIGIRTALVQRLRIGSRLELHVSMSDVATTPGAACPVLTKRASAESLETALPALPGGCSALILEATRRGRP